MRPQVFANPSSLSHGWYWALPSQKLAVGAKVPLELFGRQLLLYRGKSGKAYALDSFCQHMGANLKEGEVEGDSIRCGFHGWKYSGNGDGTEASGAKCRARKQTCFPLVERYGMLWIHSRPEAECLDPFPSFPALEGKELTVLVDEPEHRRCHHTLILGGGVDEEHFRFVHHGTTKATGPLHFKHSRVSPAVIQFWNDAPIPRLSWQNRLMHFIYRGVLNYRVTYWYASTALAELGSSHLPLYSIFAYRPTAEGKTLGINLYLTPRRTGLCGRLISAFALRLTRRILRKGGQEDARIQNSMRFQFGPRTLSDASFAAFVSYVEEQPHFAILPDAQRESGVGNS